VFYYYGRKFRLAKLYPEPKHEKIIEPFAGSAAYSLHGERWKNAVELYDTYDVVVAMWKYLISAKTSDIEALPEPETGFDIRNYRQLCDAERYIMGFAINTGVASPRNIVAKSNYNRWSANKRYIIRNLYKVKHWKVSLRSYEDVPNEKATWFIDPPYFVQGSHYVEGKSLDYAHLSSYCKERFGLAIVCEGEEGAWLDFQNLKVLKGFKNRISAEKVWIGNDDES